jgi:hypothetical protein
VLRYEAGEPVGVAECVRVELQCPADGVDDGAGGVAFAALFEPGVVVGADAGQDGDFFAS